MLDYNAFPNTRIETNETNIQPIQAQTRPQMWIPKTHGNLRRPRHSQTQTPERPQAPDRRLKSHAETPSKGVVGTSNRLKPAHQRAYSYPPPATPATHQPQQSLSRNLRPATEMGRKIPHPLAPQHPRCPATPRRHLQQKSAPTRQQTQPRSPPHPRSLPPPAPPTTRQYRPHFCRPPRPTHRPAPRPANRNAHPHPTSRSSNHHNPTPKAA